MSTTRHRATASPFDAVVVVGSHGALASFGAMAASLPRGFPAAVIFDLHRTSRLGLVPQILARQLKLPLLEAFDTLVPEPGTVYLTDPDCRLLVGGSGFVSVAGAGPNQWWHRFADVLMSGAAQAFGARLIAVVLSGQLDAGALGVRAVKAHGGRVLVQDPASAVAPSMPRAALGTGCADVTLPPDALGDALVALCAAPGAAELFRVGVRAGVG